jgi:hypothetical protein
MVPTLVVLEFPDDVGVLSLSPSAGLEGVETFRGKADEDIMSRNQTPVASAAAPRPNLRINNDKYI